MRMKRGLDDEVRGREAVDREKGRYGEIIRLAYKGG